MPEDLKGISTGTVPVNRTPAVVLLYVPVDTDQNPLAEVVPGYPGPVNPHRTKICARCSHFA